MNEKVVRRACQDTFGSECWDQAKGGGEAEVDDDEVHADNWNDLPASIVDAAGDAWGTVHDEDDNNNGAGTTDDSLNDNVLCSDDSWFDGDSTFHRAITRTALILNEYIFQPQSTWKHCGYSCHIDIEYIVDLALLPQEA